MKKSRMKKATVSIEVMGNVPIKELERRANWIFNCPISGRHFEIIQISAYVVQEPKNVH